MKIQNYFFALCTVLCLMSFQAQAQRVELEKTINQKYTLASKSNEVSIQNKYGDVVINTWNRNEITIDIEIKGWGQNENRAQEMLDKVEITYGQSSGNVDFRTEISSNSTNINERSGFQVNYTVNMPTNNPLYLENKFGAVQLADFNGKLELEVGYGQLQAGELNSDDIEIELKYSKGSIESIAKGSLEFKYSGNITIGKVGDITLTDKYGGVTIDQADNIIAEIAYSGLKIGVLNGSLELDSKYAGCTVKSIQPGFEQINAENSYGSLTLGFANNANFSFDVNTRFGGFKNILTEVNMQHEVEKSTSGEYAGVRGSNPTAEVNIESAFGGVKFQPSN